MSDPVLTVGTAGHIDHGKTALVRALTGVDTDRLPQEQERGMTIELGFAPLDLPSGRRVSVVDVPGHERFVRTMVAGAGGIDVFLLVVAADDGVMPQTAEHVAILALLGVEVGVIAVTKADAVEPERLAAVLEAARGLADAEVVAVSARTGTGIAELRAALDRAVDRAERHYRDGPLRMPIDRGFTLRGIGTVVTGTLWSGGVAVGDAVAVEPGGLTARVRSVHVHDEPRERVAAGHRVAVALPGIAKADAGPGHWLIEPGSLEPTYRIACELRVLPGHELTHGQSVTVHHGTAHTPARVAIAAGEPLQLRLQRPMLAAAGDPVIVRLTAPPTTIAGGRVLDPHPRRARPEPQPSPPPAAAAPDRSADEDALFARLAERPAITAADEELVAALVQQGRVVRAGRDLAFTREAFEAATGAVLDLAAREQGVTLAEARDRLGYSRSQAEAILTTLDAQGLTRRRGESRVLRRRGRARLDAV